MNPAAVQINQLMKALLHHSCFFSSLRNAFLLALLLLLSACTKKDRPGEVPLPNYAQLEVTVSRCSPATDPFCENTEPISGAAVFLFTHEQFQQYGDPIAHQASTAATGRCTFSTLDAPEYWVTILLPDGESLKTTIKTPAGSKSYLPVVVE